MKNKQLKPIPKFKNEDEERSFWAKNNFSDYADNFKPVKLDLSELKPSTKSVTLRLSESLLASLKKLAHKTDVPYQSLMKMMLTDQVKRQNAT